MGESIANILVADVPAEETLEDCDMTISFWFFRL